MGIAGGLAFLAGLVTAGWRWTWGRVTLFRRAERAVMHRIQQQELEKLRGLRRKMRQDRDPSTTALVRQLQSILKRITNGLATVDDSTIDRQYEAAKGQAADLYDSCVRLLDRSYALWEAAQRMSTPERQSEMILQRSELLQEVSQSMQHLNASLDQIEAAQVRDRSGEASQHEQLRDELSMGLEVARRVEDRMSTLERELRVAE